jgi:catechol 2,3-dioxygenase-like lactoylglutathione lyase family enzyme
MIGYVTLGTNQYDEAIAFYDELLAVIGAARIYEGDSFTAWSTGPKSPAISVSKPFDQQPATVGNGVMVAIAVSNPLQVDEVHAKATALGAADEGAPGPRGGGFYAAYFRDLDGNKLNVFCVTES